MCLCKEKSHTFIDSANIPALLLKTSILGCALLTSSARLLTCFMEERSAAKLCTFPFPVAFLMLSAAAPALLLFLQKLELLRDLLWWECKSSLKRKILLCSWTQATEDFFLWRALRSLTHGDHSMAKSPDCKKLSKLLRELDCKLPFFSESR